MITTERVQQLESADSDDYLLTLPWLWEAVTCGFCTYSRYIAPWIIVGNMIAAAYGVQASVWRILNRP